MKNTKFVMSLLGTVGLLAAGFLGKFSGELGMWVATIVCAYCGSNALITRAALQNGKETPQ
jgi:hypothetical protein